MSRGIEELVDELVALQEPDLDVLQQITVLLREELNRENEHLRLNIDKVITKFNQLEDESALNMDNIVNYMKFFINFVAENETNCDLITNIDKDPLVKQLHHFLQHILQRDEYNSMSKNLVVIFLRNAIISNTDQEVLERVLINGYPIILLRYASTTEFDNFITVSDLLRDLAQTQNHVSLNELTIQELQSYILLTQKYIGDNDDEEWVGDEELDDQLLVICTDVICRLSRCNNGFIYSTLDVKIQSNLTSLCELLQERFVKYDETYTKLSRNLFDAMGLISSDVKNSNKLEILFNISVIAGYEEEYKSPYSVVASLITMGNSVNSLSDKQELLQTLDHNKLDSLIWKWFVKFSSLSNLDIVLLQGIHFFTLVWEPQFSNIFMGTMKKELDSVDIDHLACLVEMFDRFFTSEVMTYYQPVTVLMCKFLNKLVSSIYGLQESREQKTMTNLYTNDILLSWLINDQKGFTLFDHFLDVLTMIKDDFSKNSIKYQLQIIIFKFINKIVINKVNLQEQHLIPRFNHLVLLLLEINEPQPVNRGSSSEIPYDFICEKLKSIALILSGNDYYHYLVPLLEEDDTIEDDNVKLSQRHRLTLLLDNMKEIVVNSDLNPRQGPGVVPYNNLKFIGGKLKLLLIEDDEEDVKDETFVVDEELHLLTDDDDEDDDDYESELAHIADELMSLL